MPREISFAGSAIAFELYALAETFDAKDLMHSVLQYLLQLVDEATCCKLWVRSSELGIDLVRAEGPHLQG